MATLQNCRLIAIFKFDFDFVRFTDNQFSSILISYDFRESWNFDFFSISILKKLFKIADFSISVKIDPALLATPSCS